MNPLFQETQQNTMKNKFQSFMQNPMQQLMNSKLNVPQEYAQDPHSAVDYLVRSGQVNQESLNKAMQIANKLGIKLR